MNDLLQRLVEEECHRRRREWAMEHLEKLGRDEAAALTRAGLVIPSPVTAGLYILDVAAVARSLRSSRSLQGSPPTPVHWKGFTYLGYFVERARVVACVWALRPYLADPRPSEFWTFWASIPDAREDVLFVWPEWENWEEFASTYPDLEGRHEPLGEWLALIRLGEPGAVPVPHPAQPPSTAVVMEPPHVAAPNEVVFRKAGSHYEVEYEGRSGGFSAPQVVLLMRLAEGLMNATDDAGFVRRDELMDLVQSKKNPSAAFRSLIRRTKDGLKKSGIQLSIRYHTSGGDKLIGGRKGERLKAWAEAELKDIPGPVREAAMDLNSSYGVPV